MQALAQKHIEMLVNLVNDHKLQNLVLSNLYSAAKFSCKLLHKNISAAIDITIFLRILKDFDIMFEELPDLNKTRLCCYPQ